MNNPGMKWLAVEIRHGFSKKVAEALTRTGIKNFLPCTHFEYEVGEKKKTVRRPLFENWIFVSISTYDQEMEVMNTSGVLNFLYWRDCLATIPAGEIELMDLFLNEHRVVTLEKTDVGTGQANYPSNGSIVVEEDGEVNVKGKLVKAFLPSLGYILVSEIGEFNLGMFNSRTTRAKS